MMRREFLSRIPPRCPGAVQPGPAKEVAMRRSIRFLASALLGLALAHPLQADEDPRTAPVFNARHALGDMLTTAKTQGKAVVFQLQGGVTYTGKIKDVGPAAVVVTELRGKEFFDAWIPFSAIVAMEERVRLR